MTVANWSLVAVAALVLVVVATWDRVVRKTAGVSDDKPDRLRTLLALAVWFGLITGTLYGLAVLAIRLIDERLMFHHREVLWMAPVAHLVVNLVAALPIAALALLAGRTRFLRVAIGGFAFVNVVSLLLPADQIARWAMLILALGLSTQLTRFGWRPGPRAWRFAIVVAALVAMVSTGSLVLRALTARSSLAAVVARADMPNVLLIVLDTVRSENMSLYGYERPTTPALSRWAGGAGVFDMAIASTSWTLPSHATLFTGKMGSVSGGDWLHPVRLGEASLTAHYRNTGYATAGFAANLLYVTHESGLTESFHQFEDYPFTPYQIVLHSPIAQVRLPSSLWWARSPRAFVSALRDVSLGTHVPPADDVKAAPLVTDGFLEWQERQGDRPFFAMLNYFDAHAPYRAPDSYRDRFGDGEADIDRYDAAIAFLDSEVDRLLRTLEQRNVLDDTVVVITSDHGELFGEHELNGHANGLYLPQLRVPLIIRYPARVPPGVRVHRPVSLMDVPATILDLSGQSSGQVPGVSLAGLFEANGHNDALTPAFSELIRGRNVDAKHPNARTWLLSVVRDEWHFIQSGDGSEELYNISADPDETTNLVDTTRPSELETLRRLIATLTPPTWTQ